MGIPAPMPSQGPSKPESWPWAWSCTLSPAQPEPLRKENRGRHSGERHQLYSSRVNSGPGHGQPPLVARLVSLRAFVGGFLCLEHPPPPLHGPIPSPIQLKAVAPPPGSPLGCAPTEPYTSPRESQICHLLAVTLGKLLTLYASLYSSTKWGP